MRAGFVEAQVVMFAFGLGVVEVDPAQALVAEEDGVEAIGGAGTQGDRLPAQALTDVIGAVAPGDIAFGFDRTHLVAGSVLDCGQERGQRPRAGHVATGRCVQSQRVVRTLMVVDRSPMIEGLLAMGQVAQILMFLAPIVMSYLGRQKQEQGVGADGLGGLIGGLLGGGAQAQAAPQSSGNPMLDMASRILDSDGDGSSMDDIASMAMKYMTNRQ